MPAKRSKVTDNFEEKFWIYRRKMPHWRLSSAVYFVTWRLYKSQKNLSADECDIIVSTLRHFEGQRFELFAYVVMSDHVHVLTKPYDGHFLHEIVHSWKSYSAYRLQRDCGRQGRIWQEEYFDRIMRDEPEFLEKAQYNLNNPLKINQQIDEYPWVWVKSEFD